jgi:hypothetical protein
MTASGTDEFQTEVRSHLKRVLFNAIIAYVPLEIPASGAAAAPFVPTPLSDVMDFLEEENRSRPLATPEETRRDIATAVQQHWIELDTKNCRLLGMHEYWKSRRGNYLTPDSKAVHHHILLLLARYCLCVSPSEAGCERVFSTVKLIVTERRTRLSPESIRILTFLSCNLDLILRLRKAKRANQSPITL